MLTWGHRPAGHSAALRKDCANLPSAPSSSNSPFPRLLADTRSCHSCRSCRVSCWLPACLMGIKWHLLAVIHVSLTSCTLLSICVPFFCEIHTDLFLHLFLWDFFVFSLTIQRNSLYIMNTNIWLVVGIKSVPPRRRQLTILHLYTVSLFCFCEMTHLV